ncbi:MAG: NUDIX hydrolase [Clostridia bacterium]|nr:NUDIX hydrolase [Clostridia bacterium]
MEFIGIDKVHQGKFITRYNCTYKTCEGNIKQYELISRNPEIKSHEELMNHNSDAVVLIIHDEANERILLNKEYRMAVGEDVFNFPAGLIDAGETGEVAAVRELREETGLKLTKINEVWPTSYSAVGLTNETSTVIVGVATGDILPSDSDVEEIEARWYTKDEVLELMSKEMFASRTQAYCFCWCKK